MAIPPGIRQHWKFIAAAALLALVVLAVLPAIAPPGVSRGPSSSAEDADAGGFSEAPAMMRLAGAPAPTSMGARSTRPMAEAPYQPSAERKVVTTGGLRLEVQNVSTALDALTQIASRYQGFVGASSRRLSSTGAPSGSITLRIPSPALQPALGDIRAMGRVLSENTQGEDITEEYVDLSARLNNSRAQERRLLALLERAQNVSEVLAVEHELGRIRSDIESRQGRLNYLQNKADLATLTIEVSEPRAIRAPSPLDAVFDTLAAATEGFLNMVAGLVIAAGTLLPLGVVLWVAWRIYKRKGGGRPKPSGLVEKTL